MSNDKKIIEDLGGPAKVAEILCWVKPGSVQRVQNWTTRGIPAQVKLDYPHIFLRPQNEMQKASAPADKKHD